MTGFSILALGLRIENMAEGRRLKVKGNGSWRRAQCIKRNSEKEFNF